MGELEVVGGDTVRRNGNACSTHVIQVCPSVQTLFRCQSSALGWRPENIALMRRHWHEGIPLWDVLCGAHLIRNKFVDGPPLNLTKGII